ncbi:3-isopropylmalate dehydratase, large subunit [Rhizobiales bacterium GAS113]|jgi:3-isopropylmalate/(R)-2-methylmalate dehydratase large subunit|nr:3-isopropylmalate dehydratase, large subunit [Rhizobiales bacterium GAS113]
MNTAMTSAEKIWRSHVIASLGDGIDLIHIDRNFLHELSGAASFQGLAAKNLSVFDPASTFATVDHVIDTHLGRGMTSSTPNGDRFLQSQAEGVKKHGITFFGADDSRQGITHVVAVEQGIALPGMTFVCGDSHTTTVGAIGALACGIGSTDGEQVLATQTLMMSMPKTMRVRFDGKLPTGATAKDIVLKVISIVGAGGATNHAVEFGGAAIRALPISGRATICNMAVEMSARFGFVPCDDVTLDYLYGRPFAPTGRTWEMAVPYWRSLASDDEAIFDKEIVIDCNDIAPSLTWGTSPDQVVSILDVVPSGPRRSDAVSEQAYRRALAYMGLEPGQRLLGLPITGAFIGSCTNSRLDDLREAAKILRGHKVAEGVLAICTPGSSTVKRQAEAEGIDAVFKASGFQWRESGCSLCVSAGGESFPANARIVSSTSHNTENRQGPGVRAHLASPATVVASALAGQLSDPRPYLS